MAGAGSSQGEFGLQIAPMLDVMFVLLLFFMVSAGTQQRETELGIKLPAGTVATQATPISLDIDAQGHVFMNQQPIGSPADHELKDLQGKLKTVVTRFNEQPVTINPEARAKHARVVDVLNACSAADVKNIAFSTPAR